MFKCNLKNIFILIYFSVFSSIVFSKCSIPLPDIETYVPNRNAAGYLVDVNGDELLLYSIDYERNIKINIKNIDVAYSAAGGDMEIADLKKGIQIRIWYVGCRSPKRGLPKAAYIEFFSNDPSDVPDRTYLRRNGR